VAAEDFLQDVQVRQSPGDPWLAPLRRVRGKVEFDGQERVSSQTLLDMLEVPPCAISRVVAARSKFAGTSGMVTAPIGDQVVPIGPQAYSLASYRLQPSKGARCDCFTPRNDDALCALGFLKWHRASFQQAATRK
jgi:hypothetical protein